MDRFHQRHVPAYLLSSNSLGQVRQALLENGRRLLAARLASDLDGAYLDLERKFQNAVCVGLTRLTQ